MASKPAGGGVAVGAPPAGFSAAGFTSTATSDFGAAVSALLSAADGELGATPNGASSVDAAAGAAVEAAPASPGTTGVESAISEAPSNSSASVSTTAREWQTGPTRKQSYQTRVAITNQGRDPFCFLLVTPHVGWFVFGRRFGAKFGPTPPFSMRRLFGSWLLLQLWTPNRTWSAPRAPLTREALTCCAAVVMTGPQHQCRCRNRCRVHSLGTVRAARSRSLRMADLALHA
jgi:hypothetical protein